MEGVMYLDQKDLKDILDWWLQQRVMPDIIVNSAYINNHWFERKVNSCKWQDGRLHVYFKRALKEEMK